MRCKSIIGGLHQRALLLYAEYIINMEYATNLKITIKLKSKINISSKFVDTPWAAYTLTVAACMLLLHFHTAQDSRELEGFGTCAP